MNQLSSVLVVIVFLQADDGSAATTTVTRDSILAPFYYTSRCVYRKRLFVPNIYKRQDENFEVAQKWPSVLPIAGRSRWLVQLFS